MARPLRLAYAEENDSDFIRWTVNLFAGLITEGSVALVGRHQEPDAILASVWRKQEFPPHLPVILVSNENWQSWPAHEPYSFYKAIIGLYPPPTPCNFIAFHYAAVHLDAPPPRLYALREELIVFPKTRFCCFVSSNAAGEQTGRRISLVQEISRWKKVDCGGRVLNNIGYLAPRGADFLRWIAHYRYMICLENFWAPQYITEKPFQAWFGTAVPIYAGAAACTLNAQAIVNVDDGDVIDQIQSLENAPGHYEIKRNAPIGVSITLMDFEAQFRAQVLDRF